MGNVRCLPERCAELFNFRFQQAAPGLLKIDQIILKFICFLQMFFYSAFDFPNGLINFLLFLLSSLNFLNNG